MTTIAADIGTSVEVPPPPRWRGRLARVLNAQTLPIKPPPNGGKIEYFYDATGAKLKKKVTDGSTITPTDYMNGFIYKTGN